MFGLIKIVQCYIEMCKKSKHWDRYGHIFMLRMFFLVVVVCYRYNFILFSVFVYYQDDQYEVTTCI